MADTKLSDLTAVVTPGASDVLYIVQGGTSYKITFANLTSGFAASSHAHGNITSAGAIGSTASLPVITTTSGVLTVGAFGTGATDFAAGDHTHSTYALLAGANTFTESQIVSKSVAGQNYLRVLNPNTAGEAYIMVGTAATGGQYGLFRHFGNTYTPSGYYTANTTVFEGAAAGGFTVACSEPAGSFRVYTNSTLRLTITAAGSIVPGAGAIATNATDGMGYMPGCAGTPTGTPTTNTGRVPYVFDTTNGLFYVYHSAAWTALGTGSGAVATDTIWDAKGDLAGGTGSNTAARLAVGTNGQVLTADSGEATGLKWATVAGTGDVVGPAGATDNAVARFDTATGKLLQDSAVTIADTSGNITGGTYNKVTITAPATGATLTIIDGKTLTASNTITFTATDGSTLAIGTGGTLGTAAYTATTAYAAASHTHAWSDITSGVPTTLGGYGITDAAPLTSLTDRGEPTGFVNPALSTLAYDGGTRVFTLAPTGANYIFWHSGTRYTGITKTVTLAASDGLHYVYLASDGTLTSGTGAWDISAGCPVATVYRNGSGYLLFDERHGVQMDGQTQEYLHETRGAAYASGGAITPAADGSACTVAAGEWYDDDREWTPAEQTTGIMVYRASGLWTWTAAQAAYYAAVSGPVPAYDNAGTLTGLGANKYGITWVYWTNNTTYPVQYLVGQAEYNTQALAEAATPDGLTLPPWLGVEAKLLYRLVWQRNGATITYKSTADYRRQLGGAGAFTATDHSSLSNLAWTTSGHTGTASNLAGWDASNQAAVYAFGTTAGTVAAGDHAHASLYQPLDSDLTAIAGLTTARGNVLYYGASGWAVLAPSTDGYQLTTHGAGADPTWEAAGSGSGSVATDTIWDAKGDLAGGTGANTAARLAVGTNGYVLTADSSEATGLKWAAAAAGVSDGDKGDITVSNSGATWTIDAGVVTYAKMQDVSATDKVLGRSTAGSGDVEEIACTAAGRALLDDADAAAQRTTLGCPGPVVQRVVATFTTSSCAYTSGIPLDNTKPQSSEGVEVVTLAITPKAAGNKLSIIAYFPLVSMGGGTGWLVAALFKDSGADALQSSTAFVGTSGGGTVLALTHTVDAGSTSSQTFKIRFGPNSGGTGTTGYVGTIAGSSYFNGTAVGQLSITEYIP